MKAPRSFETSGTTCLITPRNVSEKMKFQHKNLSIYEYLEYFEARSQNFEKRLLASSCLSVRPHGTTVLTLAGFIKFDV